MAPPHNSISELVAGSSSRGQDEIVIAVMGTTGAGKSSFIKLLTGSTSIKIGDKLQSETSEIQVVRFLDKSSGRNVTIVDTPGFDDSRDGVSDTDILRKITEFLLQEYDENRKLNGLVFIQRISDPRFSGQSSRNLRMFRNLCGANVYKNIVVLTTFWDRVESKESGVSREEELKSNFFKDLVAGGARFMRHNRTNESARQVLGHISMLTPSTPQISIEIRKEGKSLEDTAAGSVRREEVEHIIAKHKKEVEGIKAEMEALKDRDKATRLELEKERAQLQQELVRWESERSALRKGLDEETRARERLEAEAAKEKENREKARQEQERDWSHRFEAQSQAHDKSMQKLQTKIGQGNPTPPSGTAKRSVPPSGTVEKSVPESAVRMWPTPPRLLTSQNLVEFMKGESELAEEIPFVPSFVGKPALGAFGFVWGVAKQRFS